MPKNETSTAIAPQRKAQEGRKEYSKEFITASYFGFSPITAPAIEKHIATRVKNVRDPLLSLFPTPYPFGIDLSEKLAFLEQYEMDRWESLPPPVMVSYKRPLPGSDQKKTGDTVIGLEIFGLQGSIAEALLIRSALSLLEDEGVTELTVVLNSIGDKESIADYERMLSTYVRKNGTGMPPELKKIIKESIFALPTTTNKDFEKWRLEAPKSMSFLSENSRKHFKEVVEYVESFGIPYEIDTRLLGSPAHGAHTVFEIRDAAGKVHASGYRYSKLSRKLGFKKEVSVITATVVCGKIDKTETLRLIPKPRFYLVQLGFGAKAEALQVIETLRKAKIAVGHSLAKDKLQSQLGTAENMKVSHILLIGQKEAYDRTVVVRDNETRAQESVSLDSLVSYLKNLK
jgi:histidyl-tRNA synthetase